MRPPYEGGPRQPVIKYTTGQMLSAELRDDVLFNILGQEEFGIDDITGLHTVHLMIEKMRSVSCPITGGMLSEALVLAYHQYGTVDVRTVGARPSMCTILMMFCKAELKCLHYVDQIATLRAVSVEFECRCEVS